MFLGSTPVPLPLANAAMRSVQILKSDHSLRHRLDQNTKLVKAALCAAGKLMEITPGPIVPIVPRSTGDAISTKERLLKAGIFPAFVKYATGPQDGYFRFVISSEHTKAQLSNLLEAIESSTGKRKAKPKGFAW